jgi:hypothetical protein
MSWRRRNMGRETIKFEREEIFLRFGEKRKRSDVLNLTLIVLSAYAIKPFTAVIAIIYENDELFV